MYPLPLATQLFDRTSPQIVQTGSNTAGHILSFNCLFRGLQILGMVNIDNGSKFKVGDELETERPQSEFDPGLSGEIGELGASISGVS